MSKDMCPGNRPNSNTESGLTPTGGGSAGERPGSAPKGTARRPPRATRPALRRFFASGTAAAAAPAPGGLGGLPADVVDELAATLSRLGRGVVVEVAAAATAAGVDTEAFSRPGTAAGPDDEPDAQPAKRGHRCVGRRVDVLTAAGRANSSTPLPAGTWR